MITAKSTADKWFDTLNILVLSGFALLILYPLYFVVIASVSEPDHIYAGKVWIWPKGFTLEGYSRILSDPQIWTGYGNSIIYAAASALISVALTIGAAYPLSRKDFYGRNVFMLFFVFTMFFSGGLIPTYLLVKKLGMVDTIWSVILPSAVDAFGIIIARTFFQSTIPDELREAAFMDGCKNTRFLWSIVIPLSKPIIAVLVLFAVVRQWNGFFDALIYLENEKLYPLQLVLRNILVQSQPIGDMVSDIDSLLAKQRVSELIKYGVILIAAGPLLILYPFLQRYFVKGVLIGSVKG
ncbi:Melibiose/raffinose/stachyose import permease protein MelC [Paenibacillus allorhizoplanae]|uniref:Melibiose/raffinose/stachyose import permease protein MelC n=2 Tax=Paenibacillus allorhizoplanae TaxID=2905648 RepID=A0ABM9CN33_9BACL|nr:Melibiose/raffinose/stachyose import permease protein MelC [Paenibacillus allorhizoplanae]